VTRKKERKEIKANVSFPPRKIQTNPAAIEKKREIRNAIKKEDIDSCRTKSDFKYFKTLVTFFIRSEKGKKKKKEIHLNNNTSLSQRDDVGMGVRHDARTQLSMLHPSRRHALTQREKYVTNDGATGSFSFATSPGRFFILSMAKSGYDVAKWRKKKRVRAPSFLILRLSWIPVVAHYFSLGPS